ncbi:MAG: NADH-quinone oxidoreductase subunit A [Planctomycetia bacterium]|jgi:NADH-quinone oxidoreductase subunit A
MLSTSIVAYIVLFVAVGAVFLFAALLLGRFLRPKMPTREKLATYECGEPAVGTSRVRFDLRFYVVALLFVVFDVEIAFFFPWAAVFGTTTELMDPKTPKAVCQAMAEDLGGLRSVEEEGAVSLKETAEAKFKQLGVSEPTLPAMGESKEANNEQIEASMRKLAITAMVDIGIFFAVLMVGFIYLWYRGDLDWVKAYQASRAAGE